MTYVVTEACIQCKYADCVDVCPVGAFHEGPNFLAIEPDECIDCGVCVPECPVAAILEDGRPVAKPSPVSDHQRRPVEEVASHRGTQEGAARRRRLGRR